MSVARELSEQQAELVAQLRGTREELGRLRDREAELKEQILSGLDGADLGCYQGRELVKAETTWRTTLDVRKFRADPMYGHLAPLFSKETPVVSVRLI